MLLTLLFSLARNLAAFAADGAVNLADLGFDGFTPYVVERDSLWAALPAAAIAVLLVHLKRNRKKQKILRRE